MSNNIYKPINPDLELKSLITVYIMFLMGHNKLKYFILYNC